MKKTNFYTLRRHNGKVTAELQTGYSDGEFFYYKTPGGTWFAIHPGSGLSVCTGDTRKEAAAAANSPQMTENLARVWARDGEKLAAQFTKLINAAKRAAIAS